MKNLIIYIALCTAALSCSKGKDVISEAYFDAVEEAKQSLIAETKLFAGFEIGMTEQQVDSVIKEMLHEYKLEYFTEANQGFGTIHEESDYTINSSVYCYFDGDKTFYITFTPTYVEGRLSGLFCSAENQIGQMLDKPIHKLLCESFEKSSRGEQYNKFAFPLKNDSIYCFIKDNLEISFYPQEDSSNGTIDYKNLPEVDQWKSYADSEVL